MKTKNAIFSAGFAVMAAALAGAIWTIGVLQAKIETLENKNAVIAATPPVQDGAGNGETPPAGETGTASNAALGDGAAQNTAEKPSPAKDKPGQVAVRDVDYSGRDEIIIFFENMPDMSVAGDFITAEPVYKGKASVHQVRRYDWRTDKTRDAVAVTGDFVHRTNITLRVRAGLPSNTAGVESMKGEITRIFQRKDESPAISFRDKGRYLPMSGRKAVAIDGMNITSAKIQLRPIPAGNIIELLALEEGAYSHIWTSWYQAGKEEKFATDLAGAAYEKTLTFPDIPNRAQTAYVELDPGPSGVGGIYVVRAANEERGIEAFRVVCVTDLAISCRWMNERLVAWATSLETGKPVSGVEINAYSTANIKLASGTTGESGLCELILPKSENALAIVARKVDGSDMTFMQLRGTSSVEEQYSRSYDPCHLADGNFAGYVWSERGIYRHGENIFVQAIVRDYLFNTPEPMPVKLILKKPGGNVFDEKTIVSDATGTVSWDGFCVPGEQPSGTWSLAACLPDGMKTEIARTTFEIADFVPPQVRVEIRPERDTSPENRQFKFTISARHLSGAPADSLGCEARVLFTDTQFSPEEWKGWAFGDDTRRIQHSPTEFDRVALDGEGKAAFNTAFPDGLPAAAVEATIEGTVFEDGGRPAVASAGETLHVYPFYIGAAIDEIVRKSETGYAAIPVACVKPDGAKLGEKRVLKAKIERIDCIYSYVSNGNFGSWKCERTTYPVHDGIEFETTDDGTGEFELPVLDCGDYRLSLSCGNVSFSREFYLGGSDDSTVRAPLSIPSKITIEPDKHLYRPGDRPVLAVRSPFAGFALIETFREDIVSSRVVETTNATFEIELDAVGAASVPSLDVAVTMVQAVSRDTSHLAFRAHGETQLRIRPSESEIPVKVDASFSHGAVEAEISAPGAAFATVTLVDEGINILTGEEIPDPAGSIFKVRSNFKMRFDIFSRLLPVIGGEALGMSGAKTGGGAPADFLSRISPTPSRRFKPLAIVENDIEIVDGKAKVRFSIPEFSGEVRITAVARSNHATGSAATHLKVSPALEMNPDAPRFVSPGDRFAISLPLSNWSGSDGEANYSVEWESVDDPEAKGSESGTVSIKDGKTARLHFYAKAAKTPSEMKIVFRSEGFGETHADEILLPVRPAATWVQSGGTVALSPGGTFDIPKGDGKHPFKFAYTASPSRFGELKRALEWLSEYPHGCLEQTSSRIFPLITASGILNRLDNDKGANREKYVEAGVRRVESMIRENDFVMWPDCDYPPWDAEVSQYAAHFLVEAYKSGIAPNLQAKIKVMEFLDKWAGSADLSKAAYACHTLALAGAPKRGKMLYLYDKAGELTLVSRARLARAFALAGDPERAKILLDTGASPDSVKEAAFALLALLEVDSNDGRIPALAEYLTSKRDGSLLSWGTTESNAHALLALGAWYRTQNIDVGEPEIREAGGKVMNAGSGTAFITWASLTLPDLEDEKEKSGVLSINRRYLTSGGKEYDSAKARCGDLVIVELTLKSTQTRSYNDLVIQDLLPGACEPVRGGIAMEKHPWIGTQWDKSWVMRHDCRDDRTLVFSKKFNMEKDSEIKFYYPVRVVSAGDYAVAGASVEAMYDPLVCARSRPGRFVAVDRMD